MMNNYFINPNRIYYLNNLPPCAGNVLYHVSRDQRHSDNWALLHSALIAKNYNSRLFVCFCYIENYPFASQPAFNFMFEGLKKFDSELKKLNIPFIILKGKPEEQIPKFIEKYDIKTLVCDFDPLKFKMDWQNSLSKVINIPYLEVDAHNIIPCRIASNHKEFSARTLRTKINSMLNEYLVDFPKLQSFSPDNLLEDINNQPIYSKFTSNSNSSGSDLAIERLVNFINNKLSDYPHHKNNAGRDATSRLSAALHFGQISAQRIALEISRSNADNLAKDVFLEELIVRRELADNFCFYEKDYDNFNGLPDWAKSTLNKHAGDKRNFIYTPEQFENADTHDKLWNHCQKQLIDENFMHGYLRMYWAKKILEWSPDAVLALNYAMYLNDKYQLDGRDANGYAGICWSIGGLHDRPFAERPVFGQIRYMTSAAVKRHGFNLMELE